VLWGAGVAAVPADEGGPAASPGRRWITGDLHVHVSPPDAPGHSKLDVAGAIARARGAGLDFVVLTPHSADELVPGDGGAARTGQAFVAEAAAAALAAPPPAGPDGKPGPALPPLVVVAGWEFTRTVPGHLGLSFFRMADVAKLDGDEKARRVVEGGGLAVVNHPYFRPVKMAPLFERMIAESRLEWSADRSWKPFLGVGRDALAWNAIEVWHERSVLVEKMHAAQAAQFPDTQMARDAFAAWDRAVREQRRRIVGVGGSDCHGRLPYALVPMRLVSVEVETFDEEGLRRGLVAGRVTFGPDGGAAARDFAATSDVPGERAEIGGTLRARAEVRLTWEGRATLWEDGTSVGEFEGGAVRRLDPPGSFHAWRIRKAGDACSNMIHANL
jgi:hypothetical protein